MKIDRLVGILAVLLRRGQATMPQLARRFEVSRRTIARDIDDLCRAGIPLVTTQGRGGGVSVAAGFRLDTALFTRQELETLLMGARGIESVVGPSQAVPLEKLVLPAGLREPPMSIDLASHYYESLSQKMAVIRRAMEQKRVVAFVYYSEKGDSRRRTEPYRLLFRWGDWYLWAYCLLRRDFRLFKINRLWELELTSESFPERELPPAGPEPERYFSGPAVHLKALFTERVKYRLVEEYGPGSWTETPSGLLFERDFVSWENLRQWVQSFGDQAKVLEPQELREELARQAANLLRLYGET